MSELNTNTGIFTIGDDTYEGEFNDIHYDGFGIYKGHGDWFFEGIWEKGEMKKGKYSFSSGNAYEGQFHNNLFHGQGKYTWASGSEYIGSWNSGLFHGRGCFRTSNSEKNLYFKNGTGIDNQDIKEELLVEYESIWKRSCKEAFLNISHKIAEGAAIERYIYSPTSGKSEIISPHYLTKDDDIEVVNIVANAINENEVNIEIVHDQPPGCSLHIKQCQGSGQCVLISVMNKPVLMVMVNDNLTDAHEDSATWKIAHIFAEIDKKKKKTK
eukprot:GHVL01031672.1.p1 GENE.GHVL01031672.1~~GHVL01031672.1.p1  ORF type:complete len:269 (+),score=48.92 GHVL01031672.1:24-830(+)